MRYRIVYPPNQSTFGWKVDGIADPRVGAARDWAGTLLQVSHAVRAGHRPLRVILSDGSSWHHA